MALTENQLKAERDWRYSRLLIGLMNTQIHVSTPEEKAAFKNVAQPRVLAFFRKQAGDSIVGDLIASVGAAKSNLYGNCQKG